MATDAPTPMSPERPRRARIHWRDRLFLRPSEAAEVLGLKTSTIRARIRAGKLRPVHDGTAILIPVEEIERYAAALGGESPDSHLVEVGQPAAPAPTGLRAARERARRARARLDG